MAEFLDPEMLNVYEKVREDMKQIKQDISEIQNKGKGGSVKWSGKIIPFYKNTDIGEIMKKVTTTIAYNLQSGKGFEYPTIKELDYECGNGER